MLLFLTVDPPHITKNLEDKSVAIGADITFRIEASGDSLEFQWKKNGDDIDGNESQLCSSKPNTSTLHIPTVKESDKGCYKCLVKNPSEIEISSHEAELTICKFVAKYVIMLCGISHPVSQGPVSINIISLFLF